MHKVLNWLPPKPDRSITIGVQDLVTCVAFYRYYLGCEHVSGEAGSDAVCLKTFDGTYILFIAEKQRFQVQRQRHCDCRDQKTAHKTLTIEVPSLEYSLALLHARRFKGKTTIETIPAWNIECLVLTDPEGNTVRLISRKLSVPHKKSSESDEEYEEYES